MWLVLRFLGLRDAELIKRWRALVRYATEVPRYPAMARYASALDTSQFVTAHRQKWAPSFVTFSALSAQDLDEVDGLEEGAMAAPFFKDYKVSLRHPFILSETEAVTMTKRDGQPDLPEGVKPRRFTVIDVFRRTYMIRKTPFFTPTAEELDVLLAYLEYADMSTINPRES